MIIYFQWIALLGWVLAAVANSMVVYGLYPTFSKGGSQLIPENILDNNTAAFYNAVSRPVWCLGLAWVVLACHNGYGGENLKFRVILLFTLVKKHSLCFAC